MTEQFSPQSKVWIYQSDRELTETEVSRMKPMVAEFVKGWIAHGEGLLSAGDVLHKHFIVLTVDETRNPASGCSIDTSTRFVKDLEQSFSVNFFDRLTVALWIDEKVKLASKDEVKSMLADGIISSDTLMFSNAVQTKADFEECWLIPIRDSWLSKTLSQQPVD